MEYATKGLFFFFLATLCSLVLYLNQTALVWLMGRQVTNLEAH